MADLNHLEKMGRELKCPICLSLLNSAVSLTCNHIFCNSCILKSMKSDSSCPVCKVPFRRREVRPAPHMDSLVNIYKSMEVASGVNIFVTQNGPTDGEKQALGDQGLDIANADGNDHNEAKGKGPHRKSGSRRTTKCNKNLSGSNKPSFPANKRVQVPQHPLTETPTRPEKNDVGSSEVEVPKTNEGSSTLKEKSVCNENGKPELSPFFWLREEDNDADKSSQHTESFQSWGSPMPKIPSFSDIKDSDDEHSPSPMEEMCGPRKDADFFDSEMFEWTQSACSPELYSSPIKMQVPDSEEAEGIDENESKEPLLDSYENGEHNLLTKTNTKPEQGSGIPVMVQLVISSPKTKEANGQSGSKKFKKRGRKAGKAGQEKAAKKNIEQMFGSCVNLKEPSDNFTEIQNHDSGDRDLNLKRTITRKCFRSNEITAAGSTPEPIIATFDGSENPSQREKDPVTELPALLSKSQGKDEHLDSTMTSQNGNISKTIQKEKSSSYNMQNQPKQGDDATGQASSVLMKDDLKEICCTGKASKSSGKRKFATNPNCSAVGQCKKRAKSLSTSISRGKSLDGIKENHGFVSVNSEFMIEAKTDATAKNNLSSAGKSKLANAVLRKCEALPEKVKCAFCHSSANSEELGEIVHYCNGRPVLADYSGETKVIHSHKICAEWAPNVYFEDNVAVNLEAELSRSRRIKCCLCGFKGAALGCYEKSCRKSFHVPCAKSVSQCRWDNENFVMLCPLHSSSKLPNENVLTQQREKNCVPNRKLHAQRNQLASKHCNSKDQIWNSCGSPDKPVICCSALSDAEREIISEFEKLSGAKVLKSYDSSVTHVIASTDENEACRRTLKFLRGILDGKWILRTEWVRACLEARECVSEEQYEITVDSHGIRDGPRLGRLRLLNKQPKLFDGCKFYFMGEFVPSYKGYLQDLIAAAGGTILHRKPICTEHETLSSNTSTPPVFIVYSLELPDKCDVRHRSAILTDRQSKAEALAVSTGAKVATNTWILNSIAACRLQSL